MRFLLLVFAVLFGLSPVAWAGDCRLESSTCVDTSASKTISGVVVTLADVGGCWEFQDNYTCIKPNSIDYCAALTAAGFAAADARRTFTPHVTLVRKMVAFDAELPECQPVAWNNWQLSLIHI